MNITTTPVIETFKESLQKILANAKGTHPAIGEKIGPKIDVAALFPPPQAESEAARLASLYLCAIDSERQAALHEAMQKLMEKKSLDEALEITDELCDELHSLLDILEIELSNPLFDAMKDDLREEHVLDFMNRYIIPAIQNRKKIATKIDVAVPFSTDTAAEDA